MYYRNNCIWLIRDKEFETLDINNPIVIKSLDLPSQCGSVS